MLFSVFHFYSYCNEIQVMNPIVFFLFFVVNVYEHDMIICSTD
jgi:hypothetical protein